MADGGTDGDAARPAGAGRRLGQAAVLGLFVLGLGACVMALLWEQEQGDAPGGSHSTVLHYGIRVAIVVVALMAWFRTQSMIAGRSVREGAIADGLHELTAPLLHALQARPRAANLVLILSSACIDLFGLFLIGAAVFGPSMRPFLALLVLFGLRQTCQALCALPPPPGMIWRHPGVPALLVTYAVGNDFFFSGHTAIAVLGALELARLNPWLGVAGGVVAALEAAVVITLRAHYTMDVFAAALAAWASFTFAAWVCAGM